MGGKRAKWLPAEPETRRAEVCGSWPHCDLPPAEGGLFCAAHKAQLDRVKADLRRNPRYDKDSAAAQLAPTVTVTHIAPEPRKRKPTKPAERQPPKPAKPTKESARARLTASIVAALKGGPLESNALAAACGVEPKNFPFCAARGALLEAGKVLDLGPGVTPSGGRRQHVYSLPDAPAAEQAA
jgi:hypothetical protein